MRIPGIAVDRMRKLYRSFVVGDRSTQTGLKLWDKITGCRMQWIASDYTSHV
jgi:IS1 family transposase